MNKYGTVALRAVELIRMDEQSEPLATWNTVAPEVFGVGSSSQRKVCPRDAFLRLCEKGLIRSVASEKNILKPNNKNKAYAVEAIKLLIINPVRVSSIKRKSLVQGIEISNNQNY